MPWISFGVLTGLDFRVFGRMIDNLQSGCV